MNKSYYWLTDESRKFLDRGYLAKGQTAEERILVIADRAEELSGITGFGAKFEDYMSRGWFSLSSPVWSNYGTDRGLPVSCFGSYIEDNMESILKTHAEVGILSKFGGGTSGYFGALRARGDKIGKDGKSDGAVSFIKLFDTLANVVSQGSVRRGHFSPYLDIEHGDFDEFVDIGADHSAIQNSNHGICVSDAFMKKMIDGDAECRRRWAKVIQQRGEVGFPYIFFSDTVNRMKPEAFKDKPIYASNMCSEICLPSDKDNTFVCVLSSMNLLHYDQWKDTDAVETLTIFLDTVCTEFIEVATKMAEKKPDAIDMIQRAIDFCENYRALGLGVLGWHSYLQSKMIAIESREAAMLNVEIFKTIREKAEVGSAFVQEDQGHHNATLMAIAPTKSSSFILGNVSQGIEPELSNYFVDDLAKIKTAPRNPYLTQLLNEKDKNTHEVWQSILQADGSVQHLDFLTQNEKDVFKTLVEINPEVLIDHAAIRQNYIDQSQSLNLMVDPTVPTKEINRLYIRAWEMGVKTLYYQYNLNAAQSKNRQKFMNSGCTACEG